MSELHKLVIKGDFKFPWEISQEAKHLIQNLIKVDPTQRLTIPQIYNHPWLKETRDDSDSEEETTQGVKADEKKSEPDENNGIGANINFVNVDNLFYQGNYDTKLSYNDYCSVTEDYTTHHIDEEAIKVVEKFGYPRDFLVQCLNNGDLNHATASYYLLVI